MRSLMIAISAFLVLSCAEQHNSATDLKGHNFEASSREMFLSTAQTLLVVDDKDQPVGNAKILIGEEPGKPFEGNVLTSDQNGLASIPAEWKAQLPVTVSATGYVTRTVPDTAPEPRKIRLGKQEGTSRFEVKGDTTNFGRLITDGLVDFSLVMPTLSRNQLLSFDLSTVVSPETDTLDILGNEFDIPSNITLPEQDETYIFNIHLDKPQYRHIFRDPTSVSFFASHGQFPIQKVVGDLRKGKSIFDVINYFNFLGGGYRSVSVNGDMASQDIKVDEVKLDGFSAVQAPNFGRDKLIFSLAAAEKNGLMTPFDLKRLTSGAATKLKTYAGGGSQFVISMVMPNANVTNNPMLNMEAIRQWPLSGPLAVQPTANMDFSQLSLNLEPAGNTVQPNFVPWVNKPTVSENQITFSTPSLPTGLVGVATYAAFSEIEMVGKGDYKMERRTRLWELVSDGWVAGFNLPKVTFSMRKDRNYRWEVIFLARPAGVTPNPTDDGSPDLTTISHLTRNVTNL